MSEDELAFFERISAYVIWAGRYSHPKARKGKKFSHKGEVKFETEDIEAINAWVAKLNDLANYSVYLEKTKMA